MNNRITTLLNIEYPIILGGMGNISNSHLVSAVSEAGGLGTIGCGTMTPGEVEKIIINTKKLTDKPFAVNIAINVTEHIDELLDVIIKYDIHTVSLSAGNPTPYISLLKENNVNVLTIVGSVYHAVKASESGADAIVAEGFEAAGINSNFELTTMTLIPQIVEHVTIPVIAAGGVGDGKGLAAVMMLGAEGVQMGTRFIATKEAPFHDNYKQAIIHAKDTTTEIIGRSVGRSRRVIPGDYVNTIKSKEQLGMTTEQFDHLTNEEKHIEGAINGNFASGYVNSGQVSGLIKTIPSTKQLIEDIMKDAQIQINMINKLF